MRIVAALLACLALAACGEDEQEPGAPAGGGGGSLAELTVTVDPDGDGAKPARRAKVSCAAPEDSAACRAVSELDAKAFEPTPGNMACTQQYGGPQTASVKGMVRGEPVDATFSRENGCEISRWQAASALLEAAG